ncbi:MAG TPA: cupin domain-containing protein [Thermomicrobiales bacterium]|nr:cupin domain-containing protein [Thermomicrobiales bacterium]
MHTVDTRPLDLLEGWFERDKTVHFRGGFALHGDNGTEDSAAVVIELEPGWALGEHTDSPEEILLVMTGTVEVTVGNERQQAGPGTVAVVPAMVRHSIRNAGDTTARVIGFFPSRKVVSEFVAPIQPRNVQTLVHGGSAEVPAVAD